MRFSLLIAVFMFALFVNDAAQALPRFASSTGARCQSCHVNPSGGGMRQAFGVQYGRDELPVPAWSEEYGLDDFSTKLTEFVSVGADFRTLYFYQQLPDTGATAGARNNINSFWQMQGDVYFNFTLAKRVNIYLDKGLYNGFEVFGLLGILPEKGYIKVGKFVPNFGLKMDEHRAFVRQYTGFSAEFGRPELTGGEIAISPGPATLTGGVYNATDGFGVGVGNKKAFLGRADAIFKANEEINIGVGANVFTTKDANNVRTTLLGGFGSFSYQQFTLFGEADLIKSKNTGATLNGLVTYIEADYVVTPGLDLKVAYDFYDPDVDLKSGSFSRYSIGLEFFPIAGVEVRPMYRILKEDPTDVKNDEFHFLIHFYL